MEKKIIIILIIIMLYFMPNRVLATQNSTDEKNEIISSQEKALGIGDFISEADKYTGNIDISQIFEETVSGKLDNTKIIKYIIAILGDNMKGAITMIAGIIVVVIIHSILYSIHINNNISNEKFFRHNHRNKNINTEFKCIHKHTNTTIKHSYDNNRQHRNIKNDRTNVIIFNYIYKQFNSKCNNSDYIGSNSFRNNF